MRSFGLGEEAARLRGEKEWPQRLRNTITLRKGSGPNVVLQSIEAGARLEEHSAPGPITSSVREGSVRFVMPDEAVESATGKVLARDVGVRRPVEALEYAVCRIGLDIGGRQVRVRSFAVGPVSKANLVDLADVVGGQTGTVVRTLGAGSNLNANVLRFGAGQGVGEHINDEVDVVFVGVVRTGL